MLGLVLALLGALLASSELHFHHQHSDVRYEIDEIAGWDGHVRTPRFEDHSEYSRGRAGRSLRRLEEEEKEDTNPRPFSPYNRVLGLICSYNYGHIDPLTLIFNEYLYMCEGGWDPVVVLFTTERWTAKTKRLYANKLFCYRKNASIEIRHEVFPPKINVGLAAEHRHYMGRVVNDFDIFIYHEDDILMRFSHLNAFAEETRKFKEIMTPDHSLNENIIGFQRYRRLPKGGDHQRGAWGEQDIIEQELLEETPNFNQVCLGNKIEKVADKVPYIYVTGNRHTGAYMMTHEQVMILQKRCHFLNQSSPSREYMSSFSIFDQKEYHCGLSKIIPAERLMTFQIWHYFPQRMPSWYPTFVADQAVRVGGDYRSAARHDLPPCWKKIYDASIGDEEADKKDAEELERIRKEEKDKKDEEKRLREEEEAKKAAEAAASEEQSE